MDRESPFHRTSPTLRYRPQFFLHPGLSHVDIPPHALPDGLMSGLGGRHREKVVSRLFATTIQDSLKDKVYYGHYESHAKNGPVATYCNRWYNILKNIRWGEIRGEADLANRL